MRDLDGDGNVVHVGHLTEHVGGRGRERPAEDAVAHTSAVMLSPRSSSNLPNTC